MNYKKTTCIAFSASCYICIESIQLLLFITMQCNVVVFDRAKCQYDFISLFFQFEDVRYTEMFDELKFYHNL